MMHGIYFWHPLALLVALQMHHLCCAGGKEMACVEQQGKEGADDPSALSFTLIARVSTDSHPKWSPEHPTSTAFVNTHFLWR